MLDNGKTQAGAAGSFGVALIHPVEPFKKLAQKTLHTFYLLAVLMDTGNGEFLPLGDVGAVVADPLKIFGDH